MATPVHLDEDPAGAGILEPAVGLLLQVVVQRTAAKVFHDDVHLRNERRLRPTTQDCVQMFKHIKMK